MKTQDGYIYIIQQKDTTYYKIGFSHDDNIKNRLSNLQVGNPEKLIFVGSFYTLNISLEKDIHTYFKDYRIQGEWFDLDSVAILKLLDGDWRKEHTLYSDERDCIINDLYQDYMNIQQNMNTYINTLKHLFHYDIYKQPRNIDSKPS